MSIPLMHLRNPRQMSQMSPKLNGDLNSDPAARNGRDERPKSIRQRKYKAAAIQNCAKPS